MSKPVIEIEGFKDLYRQIERLPDKLKRRELLKVFGQVANPTVKAARNYAPGGTRAHTRDNLTQGNLKRSIGKRTGRNGIERINAVLYVGPKLKGKNKGWYAHFIEAGTSTGIKANSFMAKAFRATGGMVTRDSETRVSKYIQKQINRLSNV